MIDLLGTLTIVEGRRMPSPAGGAWDREARMVIAAAAAHGIALREDDLIYLDVHDLQAVRWRIEHGHDRDRDGRHWHGPRAA